MPVADLAVALLADVPAAPADPARLAGRLAGRLRVEVQATSTADHLDVVGRLGGDATHVVGLAPVPWPTAEELHAEASATLPAYTGVVSWHALPLLLDAMAMAVGPGVGRGAHLLITAPDPGPDTSPENLTFLREVAEALERRLPVSSRSIAWRGTQRTPTAESALEAVVEAHGRRDVIECPVAPGSGADPRLQAAAERLGARLTCADLGVEVLLDALTGVVRTVADHEDLT